MSEDGIEIPKFMPGQQTKEKPAGGVLNKKEVGVLPKNYDWDIGDDIKPKVDNGVDVPDFMKKGGKGEKKEKLTWGDKLWDKFCDLCGEAGDIIMGRETNNDNDEIKSEGKVVDLKAYKKRHDQ